MTKCTVFARITPKTGCLKMKRNFRRLELFRARRTTLYLSPQVYSRRDDRKLHPTAVEASGRLCIKTAEEKFRILKACHSSETGTYFCMYS